MVQIKLMLRTKKDLACPVTKWIHNQASEMKPVPMSTYDGKNTEELIFQRHDNPQVYSDLVCCVINTLVAYRLQRLVYDK